MKKQGTQRMERDVCRVGTAEYALLEIERVAVFRDMPRPASDVSSTPGSRRHVSSPSHGALQNIPLLAGGAAVSPLALHPPSRL